MLLIYADGDDDWRKRQNKKFGESMRTAGNTNIEVIEVPNRQHRSLIIDINATDDQIGDLITTFVKGN